MSLVNYDYGSSDDDDDDDVGNIDEKEVLNQKSDADINSTTKKEPKIGIPNSSTSSDQSNFNSSFSMVKYKKSDGKVQISAFNDNTKELLLAQPNLESDDDDELDEEEEQRRKRRKRSSKGSCLLSMLPKPKNKSKTSTTSMIPASVKNRKSEQSSKGYHKSIPATSLSLSNNENLDESDEYYSPFPNKHSSLMDLVDNNGDYDNGDDDDQIYGPLRPSDSNSSNNPIESSAIPDVNDDVTYKKFIASKFDDSYDNIKIIDVDVSKHLSENKDWLKNISIEKDVDINMPAPNSMARRKNQITFLAYQAKKNELQLKNQWAQNRLTKSQTRAKYGF